MEMCTTPYMKKIFLKNVEKRKKIKNINKLTINAFFLLSIELGELHIWY